MGDAVDFWRVEAYEPDRRLRLVAEMKLPINVVGVIPAAENMPGGGATRPGDIVRSFGGKTVEVLNPDAEGRLVLADALGYARTLKPQAVVDLATLTGAVKVALGKHAAGMFCNDERLAKRLTAAADATSERVWPLPLWAEYEEQIKSDSADVKNTGGRSAGAITAAKFLQTFAEDMHWAHLDIAGTGWIESGPDSPKKGYLPMGASGYGVRLLVRMVRDWNGSS